MRLALLPIAAVGALLLAVSASVWSPTETAHAAAKVGALSFSRTRTSDNKPNVPLGRFRYPIGEVWVTFDVTDAQPGDRITRIVRFNGEDRVWGDLNCPARGRCGFRIAAGPGDSLTEGGWSVVVLVNGVQASIGGFGVQSGVSEPKAS